MHLRTHLWTSALLGAALYRRAPARAALVVAAGVLIDLDHYLLYALRSNDWSPSGALRYNRLRQRRHWRGDSQPRYGSLRSVVHIPALTLPLAWWLARRRRWMQPIAAGLTLHLVLDFPWLNLDWRVWRRARGRCERCGVGGLARDVCYVVLPSDGGDSRSLANRAAWCRPCVLEARRSQEDRTTDRKRISG